MRTWQAPNGALIHVGRDRRWLLQAVLIPAWIGGWAALMVSRGLLPPVGSVLWVVAVLVDTTDPVEHYRRGHPYVWGGRAATRLTGLLSIAGIVLMFAGSLCWLLGV